MKKSKGVTALTIVCMLMASVLTLFAAGCIDYTPSYKDVDLTEASPGETLTYYLHIENGGDEASNNTVVTDPLDANLDEVGNITGGGVYDPGEHRITWNLGTVPAGGEFNLYFTARIIPSTPIGTVISNTASIVYSQGGPHSSNTEQTTVIAPDPLDHFEFETISSPQTEDQPFNVTIYAKDASGQTIEDFEDTANLTDLSGTINPTATQNTYTALDAGSFHSLSVNLGGTLWAWGKNDQGQTDVPAGTDYVAVSGGANHSLALRADGSLAGWGYNNKGQATPPAGSDFTAVAAGGFHSLALHEGGTLAGWGENFYGQATVPIDDDYIAVSAGYYHSLALHADGTLEAWGLDNNGQVSATPTDGGYVAISAGAYHCLALKADGTIVGWGYNDQGQAASPPTDDYVAISAGNYHSLALRSDGTLAAWGNNSYGQTTVPGGDNYTAISAGDHHCLALRSDGTIDAWGYNGYGQTDVPQGHFVSGVFSGAVAIGLAYSSNVITCEHEGKSGSSNAFDVAALLPDFSTSSKGVDLAEVVPQGTLSYDIQVVNNGAGPATGTTVVDYLDSNLENITDITAGGAYDSGEHKITWDLGTLNYQGQQDLSFSAQVKATAAPGTVISNQAQIDCAETGPFSTNTVQSTVIPGPVDHFAIAEVASPQTAYVSFPLAVTALDAFGNTATSFSGSVTISDTTGTIAPTLSGAFTGGVWSGDAVIGQAEPSCAVSVDDGSGHLGQSNTFAVEADTTYPDAEITYPSEGEVISELSVMVTGTAYDQALDSWQLSFRLEGSSDWVPLSGPHTDPVQDGDLETWDLLPLSDGIVHLKLAVTDMGELTSEDIVSVVIERQDPTAEITWPQDGALVGGAAQITGSATDGNLLRYLVSYGEGTSPTAWHPIPPNPGEKDDSAYQEQWDGFFTLYSGTQRDLAQTFKVTDGYIDRIELKLQRYGSVGAEIGLKICEVVSGTPTFNVVAESTTTHIISEIADVATWYTFEFRGEQLQPDTEYCIVLYRLDGEVDSSNYLWWRKSDSDVYADGSAWVYSNGVWINWSSGYDLTFRVYNYGEEELYGYEEISDGVLATWETAETQDGPHVIKLEVEDAYGKQATDQVTVETDRTEPAAQITSPQYGGHVRGVAEITGTATDAHFLKYQLFYGEGTGPPDIPITPEVTSPVTNGVLGSWDTTAVDDGLYTLLLKVYDQATLISDTTVQVTVDNTAPTAAITSPASGDAACGMLYIQGIASDTNFASYTLRYTQDDPDDPNALWTEISSDTLPPGTNLGSIDTAEMAELPLCLELSVCDMAGNTSAFRVDAYPDNNFPQVYLSNPEQGEYLMGDIHIRGRVNDSNLEQYTLGYAQGLYPDWEDWVEFDPTGYLVSPTEGTGAQEEDLFVWDSDGGTFDDGPYYLGLRATDGVGHTTTSLVQVWVDNQGPSGTFEILGQIGNEGWKYTDSIAVQLQINVSDAEYVEVWNEGSGIKGIYPVNLDGGSQTVMQRSWIVPYGDAEGGQGAKKVYCRLIGHNSTFSETYDDTIYVDTLDPEIIVNSPTDQAMISDYDPTVHFDLNVVDPVGDIDCDSGVAKVEIWYSDGKSPYESVGNAENTYDNKYEFEFDLSRKGYGYYSFLIKAYDAAGNVKTSGVKTIAYFPSHEWSMEGYNLRNTRYNAGIKPNEMQWPYSNAWNNTEHMDIYDTRNCMVESGGFLYIGEYGDGDDVKKLAVRKIDPDTGNQVAGYQSEESSDFMIKGLCVVGNRIYVLTMYKLYVISSDTMQLITDDPNLPDNPRDVSYYCPDGGYFNDGPVASGDFLYIPINKSGGGRMLAVRMSDFVKAWEYTADGSSVKSPAIREGSVFFSDSNYIYALDTATGDLRASLGTGDYPRYQGVPMLVNDRICIQTEISTGTCISVLQLSEDPSGTLNMTHVGNTTHMPATIQGIACTNDIFYVTCSKSKSTYGEAWIQAYDLGNLSLMWEKHDTRTYSHSGAYVIGPPTLAGGLLYVGYTGRASVFDNDNFFYFRVYDAYSGNLQWETSEQEDPYGRCGDADLIVSAGRIFFKYGGSRTACYTPSNYDPRNFLGFDNFCGFNEGVNTSLGSYTEEVTDVTLPGRGIDLEFKRTYNSYQPAEGPLGYGWDFNYNVWIYEDLPDNKVYVANGDGSVRTYTKQPDGSFKPPTGVFDELKAVDGNDPCYILEKSGSIRWEFKRLKTEIDQENTIDWGVYLKRIVDDHSPGDGPADPAQDNILELEYTEPDYSGFPEILPEPPYDYPRLESVVAPGDRTIDISWYAEGDSAFIDKITLPGTSPEPGAENMNIAFTYNNGCLEKVKDIYKTETLYSYHDMPDEDYNHALKTITEPENNTIKTIAYDSSGRVEKVTDGKGNDTIYAYMLSANTTAITDPCGYTTTHIYDSQYRLVQEANNAGDATKYTYGDDGNGKSVTDPEGRITEYISQEGNVVQINKPDGGVYKYEYDDQDRVRKEINENMNEKTYDYDDHNNLVAETDFNGMRTEYVYYEDGLQRGMVHYKISPAISASLQPTTAYEYSSSGDLSKETLYKYWNGGQPTEPLSSNRYECDALGRRRNEHLGNPDPDTFSPLVSFIYSYDDDASDGLRGVAKTNSSYLYGGLTPKEITLYDRNGRIAAEIVSRGDIEAGVMWLSTAYMYNENNQEIVKTLSKTDDSDPWSAEWTHWGDGYTEKLTYYLDNGQVECVVDHTGRYTRYEYDNAGRLAKEWNDEGLVTTYEYFRDGQLKKRVDPLTTGEVRFGYDAAGRPNEEIRTLHSALFDEEVTYTTRKTYDTRGNVISESVVRIDPDDPSQTLATLATTESYYDGESRLTQVVKPEHGTGYRLTINYTYDALGNRTDETHNTEYEAHWKYNAQGKVEQEKKKYSNWGEGYTYGVTHYTYDALGNVKTQTVCEGEGDAPVLSHLEYEYNGLMKVASIQTAIGLETWGYDLFTYDDVDNSGYAAMVGMEDTQSFEYQADGLLANETRENIYDDTTDGDYTYSSPDQDIHYSYDPLGNKVLERWERGSGPYVKTWKYDANGNVLEEKVGSASALRTTEYEYDTANRVTKKILPAAASEGESDRTYSYEYSDGERKVRETDPEGRSVTRTYDDLGREVITEGPGDYYALREYDESGNVIEERVRQQATPSDDIFKTTKYRYDNFSNRTSQSVEGEGGATYTTNYCYDLEGNHYLTRSPLGYETWYYHDLLGRLIRSAIPYDETEDPMPEKIRIPTTYRNDALGRTIVTLEWDVGEENAAATRVTYDGLSRIRKVEQWTGPWDENTGSGTGDASVTNYKYDLSGNLLKTTDAKGNSTYYSYDACGLNIESQNRAGETEVYTYNAWGEMEKRTFTSPDPDRSLTFTYDGQGKLVAEGAKDEPETQLALIEYAYDNTGNLTCVQEGANSVDMLYEPTTGRLSQVTSTMGAGTYQTYYSYLQSGELSMRQTEAGATTYAYDVAGRLTCVTDPAQRTYSLTWYDDFSLQSLALPADEGHIDYTYFEGGQTKTQKAYASMDVSQLQASFAYTYNQQGKRETMNVSGLPSGYGDYTYEYDSMGRL
ncbi:MAG: DUF11 domain-containing protein, partial [Actinobacteria bacterium]|nr:DUF11 domain-containing protein [Actinomycetota bacterium]